MRKEVRSLWNEVINPDNNEWLFDFFCFSKLVIEGEIKKEELVEL